MANCSLPNVEKRFRESNPGLADKLNAIGLKVFEDISSSNLFTRKSGNFVFNKEGTKKRISQNEFVANLNQDLGAEVVRELENRVSVDVIPLATEEDKAELDRFCDALIGIFNEIKAIELGTADKKENVLKNAPHTQEVICADEWTKPYSRQQAAFPLPYSNENKFWPSVSRVNNTHGDRNLICTCEPMESYQ